MSVPSDRSFGPEEGSGTISTGPRFDPGSFRDPTNRVVRHGGEIFRLLDHRAAEAWSKLRSSRIFRDASDDGRLVPTRELTPEEISALDLPTGTQEGPWSVVLEHEPVPFISYPFEWSFGMLRDAALLQLELLDAALEEGLTLKDASPYNLQWRGARPQFIDIGSFTPWSQGEPWVGYRQFCQLFLFPLLLRAYKDVAFQPLLRGSLEGIAPANFASLMSWRDRLRPGVLIHGWLQARFLRRFADSDRDLHRELRQSGFDRRLIQNNVRAMAKLLRKLEWRRSRSEWAAYDEECSYDSEGRAAKERFVRQALSSRHWKRVWDLGCNTGSYSEIAAEHSELVVAFDGDELSVERLYQRQKQTGGTRILPLVMDLRQPTPGLGWRGRERASLEDRGKPDMVLCLALIHHLAISASIPMTEVLDWLRNLGGELVIEFPHRDDPMVQRLLRPKLEPHEAYRREVFEAELAGRFEIHRSERLPAGTRSLYHATPRR